MTKIIKIVIIIIFILFTTGCYDYQEINNIDIITGIGIDYQNDQYIVTLEVLKNSGDKTAIKLDSSLYNGNGLSLSDALLNATTNLSKIPNYSHLKVLIISKNALENKWFNIMDFFLRNTDFRESFYVVTSNNNPNDILNTKNDEEKVASMVITNYIENLKHDTISKLFIDYNEDYLTFNKSLLFTNIDIQDDKLTINGGIILNNNKTYYLDIDNIKIYNLFNNHYNKLILNKNYNDKLFSIIITNSNLDINIKNNKIIINGNINSKILNNETNLDLRNLNTIEKLNKDFKLLLEEKILSLFRTIKEYNTDIFGIDNMNYQQNRIKTKNYWLNIDIETNIDFEIAKKGLIYEVKNEN